MGEMTQKNKYHFQDKSTEEEGKDEKGSKRVDELLGG